MVDQNLAIGSQWTMNRWLLRKCFVTSSAVRARLNATLSAKAAALQKAACPP